MRRTLLAVALTTAAAQRKLFSQLPAEFDEAFDHEPLFIPAAAQPDDSDYLNKAWKSRVDPDAPIETSIGSIHQGAIELKTGELYAPIVDNGEGLIFTAFDNANAGGYRHFDLLSGSSFAFEDQRIGGGEHDRNDGLFTIDSIDL